MTITKYDSFAILPKRCDECNRLFIFEGYNWHHKYVLRCGEPFKIIKCKKCINRDAE